MPIITKGSTGFNWGGKQYPLMLDEYTTKGKPMDFRRKALEALIASNSGYPTPPPPQSGYQAFVVPYVDLNEATAITGQYLIAIVPDTRPENVGCYVVLHNTP